MGTALCPVACSLCTLLRRDRRDELHGGRGHADRPRWIYSAISAPVELPVVNVVASSSSSCRSSLSTSRRACPRGRLRPGCGVRPPMPFHGDGACGSGPATAQDVRSGSMTRMGSAAQPSRSRDVRDRPSAPPAGEPANQLRPIPSSAIDAVGASISGDAWLRLIRMVTSRACSPGPGTCPGRP